MTTLPHELLPYKSRESDRCCTLDNSRILNVFFHTNINDRVPLFDNEFLRENFPIQFNHYYSLEVYPIDPINYLEGNFETDDLNEKSILINERVDFIRQRLDMNNLNGYLLFDNGLIYELDNLNINILNIFNNNLNYSILKINLQ